MIQLYMDKSQCCGCGMCSDLCPNSAIKMNDDNLGFKYPTINADLCVNCNLCINRCAFKKTVDAVFPIQTFAAALKSKMIMQSSSGGIFYGLASEILLNNGIVYGATMIKKKNFGIFHTYIDDIDKIHLLQGSKYVQSNLTGIFKNIKKHLNSHREVLFSGTPCQVDALKSYLNKYYTNLFLVDIVCHGVPNQQMFQDYICNIENKYHIKVVDIKFRNKQISNWGHSGIIVGIKSSGETIKIDMSPWKTSYYNLFLDSAINRDSCYSCPYAQRKRISDITLGDYWGIEKSHPEILKANGGKIDAYKGVSCVLINNNQGLKLYNRIIDYIVSYPSKLENIIANNTQLSKPSIRDKDWHKIMDIYSKNGYKAVERYFFHRIGFLRMLKYYIKMNFKFM